MEIYFIRHGQSIANKEKIFQGWSDIHLSEEGIKQVKKLSEYFKQNSVKFDELYSSTLTRAVETALPLLSCTVNTNEIKKKNNLRSINVGKWSGMAIEYAKSNYKDQYWLWKNKPTEFRFPEGESINDVLERSKCSLHSILDQEYSIQGKIAIVTHMITIKVLTLWMSRIDLDEIWNPKYTVPNTGLIIFEIYRINNLNKYRFERVLLKNPVPHL